MGLEACGGRKDTRYADSHAHGWPRPIGSRFYGRKTKRTSAILEPVFCGRPSLDYDYNGSFQRDVAA